MIRTRIVDDETLVRATLRTLVDWEALGYTIVQDCSDGGQALEYLKSNPVDVMFTDMKICQRKHSKPQCWSGSDPANAEKEVCSR